MLNRNRRAIAYGVLIWIIAFAIAIPVYSPTDQTLMHGVENFAFPILLFAFFYDYMRRVAIEIAPTYGETDLRRLDSSQRRLTLRWIAANSHLPLRAVQGFARESIMLGVVWTIIQLGLDIGILLILFKSDARDWFFQVGLTYLSMPPTFWLVGLLIDQVKAK